MKNQNTTRLLKFRFGWVGALLILALLVGCTTPEDVTTTESASETFSTPTNTITPTPTPGQPTATPTPQTPVHLAVDPADLAGVVVEFVHPWTGEMADAVAAAAAQFSLTNEWDIWVEPQSSGGNMAMMDMLQSAVETGNLPGLVAAYPYQLDALDGDFHTIPLDDYLVDPQWGLDAAAQADIPSVFMAAFWQQDRLTALPVAPQAAVIFLNQTWAAELGQSALPETPDAFQNLACEAALANNGDFDLENDGTGGWLVNLDPWVLASWYQAFEGELSLDAELSFDNPSGEAAFTYLKDGYDQGCFWVGRRPDPYFYFANRYAVAYAGTLDQIPVQAAWSAEAESADQWTVLGFPGPQGETMLVGGPGLMVTADVPENQMAAWLFARYLLRPEVQADLVRSGFNLPVRQSAFELLTDFSVLYPQWKKAASMLDQAEALPMTPSWGVGQWVLQDALWRLLQVFPEQFPEALPETLEILDATILELISREP